MRGEEEGDGGDGGGKDAPLGHPALRGRGGRARTFAEFARDQLIVSEKFGKILSLMGGDGQAVKAGAEERLERTLQNVTSTTVAGLINPTPSTEILDIIDRSRPVVDSGRKVRWTGAP